MKRRDAVNGRGEDGSLSPPARRERKNRTSRGRRVVALLGLLLALALMAAVLYRPVTHYLESRRELARAEAQLEAERSLTRDLEERRDRASSEEYVEGEARRMGYVKPGEIPLIVFDDVEEASGEEEGQATP
ncbi:MAG: septum formation initiator family protein [Actinobacteria bacterium]|nr:septum formation initiator family protein [Actinomycetota bacterium]